MLDAELKQQEMLVEAQLTRESNSMQADTQRQKVRSDTNIKQQMIKQKKD